MYVPFKETQISLVPTYMEVFKVFKALANGCFGEFICKQSREYVRLRE